MGDYIAVSVGAMSSWGLRGR